MTEQLREDHAELERLVDAFRIILAERVPPSGVELVEFRQIFSRQILAHLHREDMLLYPRLLKSKRPYESAMAQAFLDEMGGLLDSYKRWASRWPTERVQIDWSGFVSETQELLEALNQRIDKENNQLYPLLERAIDQAAA